MKKVLVTGATGFIGNHVINELLGNGYKVIATSANPEKAVTMEWYNNVAYIPLDLKTLSADIDYYAFFNKPDLLIHLAWEGLPNYKLAFHLEENLPRHYFFLENLVMHGLCDITVTGTCFEYGMQEGCLNEEMEAFPNNPYGIAKDTLRKKLEKLQNQTPFIFKWIRLFYMYGKGQNPNSLLSQLDRALLNGEQVFNMSGGEQGRDFLPVEKVAANIARVALQEKITGIVNCCSGEPITVKGFVENYVESQGKKINLNLGYYPYPDYEPMCFWGDDTKLKKIGL